MVMAYTARPKVHEIQNRDRPPPKIGPFSSLSIFVFFLFIYKDGSLSLSSTPANMAGGRQQAHTCEKWDNKAPRVEHVWST